MSQVRSRLRSVLLLLTLIALFAPSTASRSAPPPRSWAPGPAPVASAVLRPGARPATGPNIVVILTDDQSFDSLPSDVTPMPYLQSVIEDPTDHWIRFSKAFDNTPLCCPSRATLLSGQYSHHTHVQNNGEGDRFDDTSTIATWLHDAGYTTGFIGKYLNVYPWDRGDYVPPGWDRWDAFKSPPRYFDYTLIDDGKEVNYGSADADYSTDVLAGKATGFIDSVPPGKPFLLYFAPYGPHYDDDLIWVPAPRDVGAFDDMAPIHHADFNESDVSDKPAWVRALPSLTPDEQTLMDENREDEYETLLSVDDSVESVMQTLDARGVLDNTIVFFLTDNGFAFGEHRWETKTCEYEECTHIPFFVRYPGATPGTDRRHLISTVDLAPTVAQLTGVTPSTPVDGLSMVPLLQRRTTPWRQGLLMRWNGSGGGTVDPEEGQRWTPADVPAYWAVHTRFYQYVELDDGEKELYDLDGRIRTRDPYEIDNRAGDPDYAAVQERLADLLAALKGSAGRG